MKERPILFSAPMIRAILDGRKTQTRRVIKPSPASGCGFWGYDHDDHDPTPYACFGTDFAGMIHRIRCPYGAPGDTLWCRETWAPISPDEERRPIRECSIEYRADSGAVRPGGWDADDDDPEAACWRPSIHMPRWASRLSLEVTRIRVERVQDISRADEEAEGVQPFLESAPDEMPEGVKFRAFSALWDSINAARGYGWETNPWVWVVSFRRI